MGENSASCIAPLETMARMIQKPAFGRLIMMGRDVMNSGVHRSISKETLRGLGFPLSLSRCSARFHLARCGREPHAESLECACNQSAVAFPAVGFGSRQRPVCFLLGKDGQEAVLCVTSRGVSSSPRHDNAYLTRVRVPFLVKITGALLGE